MEDRPYQWSVANLVSSGEVSPDWSIGQMETHVFFFEMAHKRVSGHL